MRKPADTGFAILSFTILDRNLYYLQVLFCCTKQEIEVPERVKITEETPTDCDLLVILSEQNLGAAQGVP